MSKITDKHILELIGKVREKDEYAYAELYKYYFPKAVRIGEQEVYTEQDKAYVPNIVNDVFLKIWGMGDKKPTISQLKDDSNFENWLYQSVKWAIQDYARKEYGQEKDKETGKNRIKQRIVDNFSSLEKDDMNYEAEDTSDYNVDNLSWEVDGDFDLDDEHFSDADKTFFSKRDEIVRELVEQLSEKEKEVVSLYFFSTNENGETPTLKEVGNQLGGLSTSTVHSRLEKAQDVLKGIVEKYQKEYNVKLYSFTPAMLWYLVKTSKNAKELIPESLANTISVSTASKPTNLSSGTDNASSNKIKTNNSSANNNHTHSEAQNELNTVDSKANPVSDEGQSISSENTANTAKNAPTNGAKEALSKATKESVKATTTTASSAGIAGVSVGTKIAVSVATTIAIVGGGYAVGKGLKNNSNDASAVVSDNEATSSPSAEITATPEPSVTPTEEAKSELVGYHSEELKKDMIKAEIPDGWTVNFGSNDSGTLSDGNGGTITFDISYPDDNGYIDVTATNETSDVTYGKTTYQCLKHYSLDDGTLKNTVFTATQYAIPYVVIVNGINTDSEEFIHIMETIKYKPLMALEVNYNMNVHSDIGADTEVTGHVSQGDICFAYQKFYLGDDIWYRINGSGIEGVNEYEYGITYICGRKDGTTYVDETPANY